MKITATLAAIALAASVTSAGAVERGRAFGIPVDQGVNYVIISVKPVKGSIIRAVSRRDSTALGCADCGVTWAEREIDCKKATFRYTAEGGSLDEMEANRKTHSKEKMSAITEGSITSYIAGATCEIAKKSKS